MLQPLKNNIVNGEVLKIYNNIQVDSFEPPKNVIHISNELTRSSHTSDMNNNDNKKNRYIYKHNANHSIYLKQVASAEPSRHHSVIQNKPKIRIEHEPLITNADYDKNALHLAWDKPVRQLDAPKHLQTYFENDQENQEILMHHHNLDSEKLQQFSVENHKKVNVSLFPLLDNSKPRLYRPNSTSSLDKLKIDNVRHQMKIQQELGQLPGVKTNPIYESLLNEPEKSKVRRSTSLNCKTDFDSDVNIPIEYEGRPFVF